MSDEVLELNVKRLTQACTDLQAWSKESGDREAVTHSSILITSTAHETGSGHLDAEILQKRSITVTAELVVLYCDNSYLILAFSTQPFLKEATPVLTPHRWNRSRLMITHSSWRWRSFYAQIWFRKTRGARLMSGNPNVEYYEENRDEKSTAFLVRMEISMASNEINNPARMSPAIEDQQ
ncbi:hypothetical protein BDV96DRAFT_604470 [Lophiotrema nucula]|uniref:Uncharacterized protein n=1 Tax=Lophiotrema nucula TaxID=690887 RepID=A0A6A5YSN2_9PLEO|nr:hypothetical protein BDV96DRAFT_604470 [Lophiotrema nucula]